MFWRALLLLSAIVNPALYQGLHWRLVGPFRAGRVLAVTGVPGQPQHFYFGAVNGGVWETFDAGRTWNPIFDSQPVQSIGAIAVAPSNPGVVYVGTGEADMRSSIAQGDGMYRSADGGKSWTHIGLDDSQQIGCIIVHPENPDIVYVAALGNPYAANAMRGVFRTRDGGRTWQRVLGKDSDTGAIDLAFEPGNPNVIYAAMWQTRRPPWSVYPPSNGPGSGLFKSTDGGDNWTQIVGHGFPDRVGRIGIAVAPSQPQRVYTVVDAPQGGIYRSDDAGANWTRTSADPRVWSRGWYFGGITVEPKNADTVYSINVNVYRSTDGGKTFIPVKGAPGGDDYHTLWIDPQNPERRILGVDQGTVVSVNGGATWSSWFNQPTGQMYHVATDNRYPYWLYGAQQDSGAASVPSHTNTIDGVNMMVFREITAGGESDYVAPDPLDPQIVYGGRVEKLNLRTHETRSVDPTLDYPDNYRRTWTLPLVFSPRDAHILYYANQKLFRTTDGGEHWDLISPDLSRENPPDPPNLDPATAADKPSARPGVIYTIAPSHLADHDIWVGTDDGLIWRTRDGGAHWDNITPRELTPWSKVGIIETSHFDAETAYAAVDRHRLNDVHPYIYRTHDGGKTWQNVGNGLPDFVNVVREDPVRKGLLYAGTEHGVFISFDDGDHWQSLQMNLPPSSVRDLDVHGDDLVVATHGRAFWIMDDIAPLRSVSAGASPAAPLLYPPAVAVRERAAGFTGSPMPKDEPMAPNPPFGASIDYGVGSGASDVTLEIFDSANNLVRRYSSKDTPKPPNLQTLTIAPEWVPPPQVLSTAPGMHRFIWPIHYAAPAGVTGRFAGAEGVWAPPGKYNVVVTVDGQKFTQPLTVVPDPRLRLPQSAYDEQFTLAQAIEQERSSIASALREASALAKQRPDLAPSINKITGGAASEMFPPPPAPTDSLRFLAGALAGLQNAVDGADAAPSPDARAAWAKLKPQADAQLAAWNSLKATAH